MTHISGDQQQPRQGYAPDWDGPRFPCGCPERDDYAEHPDEPCDWSHWHPNEVFTAELREDRYCWKCGAMETQRLALDA